MPWLSPPDQPPWARPALLAIAALAATVYAWNVHRMQLHLYYGPAVKSMSGSLGAFLYGTYDPTVTLTMDKLAGFAWPQAVSARIFGFHQWSVLLPQLLATVGTILLLYTVVRRWVGPVAGLLAAAAYATTPIVGALARTQVPDVLLVLLAMLAAVAWQKALATGRSGPLLVCGLWIGLAFHVKMVHAWAAWIPFAVTYLVAASVPLARRLLQLAAAGAVTLVLSLVWVAVMMAIPASSRPYVDGSIDNSPVSMVFGYNAFNRYGIENTGAEVLGVGGPLGKDAGSPWLFMFGDGVAPQVGWLYPVALLGIVAGLLAARRRAGPAGWDRADQFRLERVGYLMWTLWLLTQAAAFALSLKSHSFYLLSVAPPLAALTGAGLVALWAAYRRGGWPAWLLPAGLLATAAWTGYVSRHVTSFHPWLPAGVAILAAIAAAALVGGRLTAYRRLAAAGAACGLAALVLAPSTWALSVADNLTVVDAHRPAAGPASRETGTVLQGRLPRVLPPAETERLIAFLRSNAGERFTVAVQWAPQAGPYILAGMTPLPIGGFTAQVPNVTPRRLDELVAAGQLRYAIVDGPEARGMVTPDYPDYAAWVRRACVPVDGYVTAIYALYDCRSA